MIAILLENAPDSLKGELTKWITLVKPSVYISEVNKRIRDVLITRIQEENKKDELVSAQVYFDAKNELGYDVIEIGSPQKDLIDFQGLKLVSTISSTDQFKEIATLCWAKLNPYKSLSDHMYETGIVAKKFLKHTKYKALIPLFEECINNKLTDEEIINTLSSIIALHDIGKCWPDFQLKAKNNHDYHIERELDLLKKQKMYNRFVIKPDHFRHELSSSIIIRETMIDKCYDEDTSKSIASIYENHHLSDSPDGINTIKENGLAKGNAPEKWKRVRKFLIDSTERVFSPSKFELKKDKIEQFNVLLLGFLYRCDWISSSLFSKEIHFDSYQEYTEYVNRTVDNYIADMGIQAIPMINHKISFEELFPNIPKKSLRPLQQMVEKLVLNDPNFDCLIIEDLTGSGKTESGLLAGINAMYAANKQGIFFGLPTNATEQAMNPRVQAALNSLYGANSVSVTHASGKSWIYDEMMHFDEDDKVKKFYASERETKLIYPFSTGTVDQIERCVQMRKYMLISLTDLVTKAVIIDEMHAYDMYMLGILETALQWLKKFHVPVIVMSATLPDTIKKIIHSVYSTEKYISQSAYPLITKYSNGHFDTFKVDAYENREYPIRLNKLDFSNKESVYDNIISMIQNKIENGGNIVCVLNSVKNAKGLFSAIKEKLPDVEKILFIGRDTLEHKEQKSALLINKYGKDRINRPRKSIVIATQIIEQSLDLDFDYMITEIAPIDLLLQRFGRWHRHPDVGTIREISNIDCNIEVVYSIFLKDHKVYADSIKLLENTLNYLKSNVSLKIPEETRDAINYVYSKTISDKEMHSLAKAFLARIDKPNTNAEHQIPLPWKKENLKSDIPTRLEKYETTDICYVSQDEYDHLKENPNVSRKIAAKLKYCNTITEYKSEVENYEESITGKGWLDGVKIVIGEITNS